MQYSPGGHTATTATFLAADDDDQAVGIGRSANSPSGSRRCARPGRLAFGIRIKVNCPAKGALTVTYGPVVDLSVTGHPHELTQPILSGHRRATGLPMAVLVGSVAILDLFFTVM